MFMRFSAEQVTAKAGRLAHGIPGQILSYDGKRQGLIDRETENFGDHQPVRERAARLIDRCGDPSRSRCFDIADRFLDGARTL